MLAKRIRPSWVTLLGNRGGRRRFRRNRIPADARTKAIIGPDATSVFE
jgi:hypothetical protein